MPRRLARLIVPLVAMLSMSVLAAIPAGAESECVADAAEDVFLGRDEDNEAIIGAQPKADILAVCAEFTGDDLVVTVRLAQPHDPAADPDWDNQSTAIGVAIDTDGLGEEEEGSEEAPGGEEFTVNLARFPTDPDADSSPLGPPQVRTFDAITDALQDADGQPCISTPGYDGVRYRLTIPVGCFDDNTPEGGGADPTSVRVAPYMFYRSNLAGQADQGNYDEVPAFPAYLGGYTAEPDPATDATRLSGPSRFETAIAVSREDYADGAAAAVVLARQDAFPDALAGAPLAVAVDGPLLLTQRDVLTGVTEAEIQRVLPAGGTVYLTGGTAAIEDGVADELRSLGYTVQRASGATRYATSVAVARAANPDPSVIVVANGNGFPEALVGGALAAAEGGVQVLSNGDTLDDTATAYLAEHPDAEVVALGADAAAAVPSATEIAGANAFETSVRVAQQRYEGVSAVGLASGTNFPDGLAGGAHAGRAGVPLLLTWPDVLPASVADYLGEVAPLSGVTLYGGTAALSHQVEADAAESVG